MFQTLQKLRVMCFMFATTAERKVPPTPSNAPFALNNLWDNPGASKTQKRWGRSGTRGNACGRGQRGQGARSGAGVPPKFEGGQTPLTRRLPKWGAKPSLEIYREVNIQSNKEESMPLSLSKQRTCWNQEFLANANTELSELNTPLTIEVSDASKTAIDAIKKAGGEVKVIYFTPLLLRQHLFPDKYPLELRPALPPSRAVEAIQRTEERGAVADYIKPKWVIEDEIEKKKLEEMAKLDVDTLKVQLQGAETVETVKKEKKKKKQKQQEEKQVSTLDLTNFKYPVSREPGCGKGKIKQRKPVVYKKLTINLD
ncbi:unnamed protein product (macronuclear) [Paramecium tetraurelia]|uniref:Large ribosomal subunit protein uL15/eL18 domain-containing protein n=1 Tax=Paramecium tetraurelia TaxID=5888 RepID=A0BTJ8_PARTE|nr:uncharacterized protein GSPATT00032097001 [Paramecium tetraurelia]CAK61865.1 unnamed protein product [Paramecium tetraurelia]|eukprot:XP_001429263.1 hypothetical protein (macronuclear) [Paramecium tetraurelia strain d4-2]